MIMTFYFAHTIELRNLNTLFPLAFTIFHFSILKRKNMGFRWKVICPRWQGRKRQRHNMNPGLLTELSYFYKHLLILCSSKTHLAQNRFTSCLRNGWRTSFPFLQPTMDCLTCMKRINLNVDGQSYSLTPSKTFLNFSNPIRIIKSFLSVPKANSPPF